MNKTVKTTAVLLAGLTLMAGTAVAAPHHGWHHQFRSQLRVRYHVVHYTHARSGNVGWIALGAGAVGAVVGGLIGSVAH